MICISGRRFWLLLISFAVLFSVTANAQEKADEAATKEEAKAKAAETKKADAAQKENNEDDSEKSDDNTEEPPKEVNPNVKTGTSTAKVKWDETAEENTERELTPKERARQAEKMRRAEKRRVDAFYLEAKRAFRDRKYHITIAACTKALKINPHDVGIERLRSIAEQKERDIESMLARITNDARDHDAISDVESESTIPTRPGDIPRPRLPLREEMPTNDGLRRMNELLNQRVDFNFVDADLNYVLQTLFKISGISIMADKSLLEEQTLTLHVNGVPLREVLDYIKGNTEGLDYAVTENAVWLVSSETPPVELRTYPLSRGLVGLGGNTASSGSRSSGTNSSRNSSTSNASGLINSMTSGGASGGGGSGDTYIETMFAWLEAGDNWPEGSQWYLDRKTTTLFVRTTPETHLTIDKMLNHIDVVPLQILVRTKFIEIQVTDREQLGLGFTHIDGELQNVDIPGATADASGNIPNVADTLKASLFTATTMEQGAINYSDFYNLGGGSELFAQLNLLIEQSRAKVYSAPQIIAINNMPANIFVGKAINYPTDVRELQSSNLETNLSATTGVVGTNYQTANIGFTMNFTPSVGRDMKNIMLNLDCQITDVLNIGVTESSLVDSIRPPDTEERSITTSLSVEDRGTVIIGGLMRKNDEIVRRRVPILGDIPLLGLLFRYKQTYELTSNLVIVVQAEIVRPNGGRYSDAPQTEEDEPWIDDYEEFRKNRR